jgi:hypothetical protein
MKPWIAGARVELAGMTPLERKRVEKKYERQVEDRRAGADSLSIRTKQENIAQKAQKTFTHFLGMGDASTPLSVQEFRTFHATHPLPKADDIKKRSDHTIEYVPMDFTLRGHLNSPNVMQWKTQKG